MDAAGSGPTERSMGQDQTGADVGGEPKKHRDSTERSAEAENEPLTQDLVAKKLDEILVNAYDPDDFIYPTYSLMGLPNEILDQIFAHVLGNQTVHIDHVEQIVPTAVPGVLQRRMVIQQSICQGDAKFGIRRHGACYEAIESKPVCSFPGARDLPQNPPISRSSLAVVKSIPHDKRLDISIMLTAKRAYIVAYRMLWWSNTFFFDNPLVFHAFMCKLTPRQKDSMGQLAFAHQDDFEYERTSYWANALDPQLLRSCGHIHTVNLEMLLGTGFCRHIDDPADENPTRVLSALNFLPAAKLNIAISMTRTMLYRLFYLEENPVGHPNTEGVALVSNRILLSLGHLANPVRCTVETEILRR